MGTILVTGGSGLIGSHSILQLLAAGHQVRTTVRSLKREGDVRAMLKEGGVAFERRVHRRHRRKPGAARAAQGQSEKSRLSAALPGLENRETWGTRPL
jgi:nucleoside-diphosphate-sugar epimerase